MGHRSPGKFSIFLHQRWGGAFATNIQATSAYCVPQLMILREPSLTPPPRPLLPTSNKLALLAAQITSQVLVTTWKAGSDSSRLLAKCLPPSHDQISSLKPGGEKKFSFLLQVSLFSFYFEAWARAIPELQKIVSMVLPNQTLKPRLGTETTCCCPAPWGKCHLLCQVSRDELLLGRKRFQEACIYIPHTFPKTKSCSIVALEFCKH